MAGWEANGMDYTLGLPGDAVLHRLLEPAADDIRVRLVEIPIVRGSTETRHGAKSSLSARVAARIDTTTKGLDIRYAATNLLGGNAHCRAHHRGSKSSAHCIRHSLPRGHAVR
jgi:hypothetical protein